MVNWRIAYEFHYYDAFVVAFSSRMSNNVTMIGSTDDFDGRTQERKYCHNYFLTKQIIILFFLSANI